MEKRKRFIHSIWGEIIVLIMVLGIPSISSYLMGYEMQYHVIQHIPLVMVDHDNSQLSRMLVDQIKYNKIFNINYYSQNDNDIENLIEQDKARVGIIIPKYFSQDLMTGKAPKVLVLYDDSQMMISSAAKARMDEILLTVKTAYLKQVMEGKLNILPENSQKKVLPMYFNYRLLSNPSKNYSSFLLSGLPVSISQVGMSMFGSYMITGKEKNYLWILLKGIVGGIVGAISIMSVLIIQFKYFALPFRGELSAGLLLTIVYSVGIVNLGILVRSIIPDSITSIQISAILVLPSTILGGFSFPLIGMPQLLGKLGNLLPFTHYAEPIRDLCLKNVGISFVLPQIYWQLKFLILMWIGSFTFYIIKKIMKILFKKIKVRQTVEEGAKV